MLAWLVSASVLRTQDLSVAADGAVAAPESAELVRRSGSWLLPPTLGQGDAPSGWQQCVHDAMLDPTQDVSASPACELSTAGMVVATLLQGLAQSGVLPAGRVCAPENPITASAADFAACRALEVVPSGEPRTHDEQHAAACEGGAVACKPAHGRRVYFQGTAVAVDLTQDVYGEIAGASRLPFFWHLAPLLRFTEADPRVVSDPSAPDWHGLEEDKAVVVLNVEGFSKDAVGDAATFYQEAVVDAGAQCQDAESLALLAAIADGSEDVLVDGKARPLPKCLEAEVKAAKTFLKREIKGGGKVATGTGKLAHLMRSTFGQSKKGGASNFLPGKFDLVSESQYADLFYTLITTTDQQIPQLIFVEDDQEVIARGTSSYGTTHGEQVKGKGLLRSAGSLLGLTGAMNPVRAMMPKVAKSSWHVMRMTLARHPVLQPVADKANFGFADGAVIANLLAFCRQGQPPGSTAQTWDPPCTGKTPGRVAWAFGKGPGLA